MPPDVTDRLAEVWRSSFVIAQTVGGHWPERIGAACAALCDAANDVASESSGVALLADIRIVFDSTKKTKFHSVDLVRELLAPDDSPWRHVSRGEPLDTATLAHQLGGFDVHSKDVRIGSTVRKGYEKWFFADAWERYLRTGGGRESPTPPRRGNRGNRGNVPGRSVAPVAPVAPGKEEDTLSAPPPGYVDL